MYDPSDEEIRRNWRLLWLSSIQAFADSETQRREWLDRAQRNPHFSLVECMNSYFCDAWLDFEGYPKQLERGHLTAEEVAAVADFHQRAEAYRSPGGDGWDSWSILADPEWQKVVEAAQEAQKRLLSLLRDETEIVALTRPLNWTSGDNSFTADLTGTTIVR
jgi:hypothetical protein